ncbi:hypothetical protein M3I54_22555 [Paraburkholderia sp. CNPSo 3274]|uniref:hypothetical protein n=1 Tax=Paraburkholderia sp. CNPSo 3274 TaxID=2940932 RepID=UPI0020B7999E|nr:hypothetical protein [Paraburkholderia sp. CNPSo 3274]MCP3709728.1 hypothetical protein [Paraburkholderia sp. CNPSo 3274]
MANFPAGFPLARVNTWIDEHGRPNRDFLYLILTLWQRTGGASGSSSGGTTIISSAPPAFLGDEEGVDEFFMMPGPPGANGIPGAIGPALLFDIPDELEPMLRGLLAPGGWFDEKGSGGTYGFAAGVDFTAGTTTSLTLSQPYGYQANLIVAFDGAFQGADQFSLSGKTLTFTSAIPVGTTKVFVKGFLMPQ